jgi:hypothetical protein
VSNLIDTIECGLVIYNRVIHLKGSCNSLSKSKPDPFSNMAPTPFSRPDVPLTLTTPSHHGSKSTLLPPKSRSAEALDQNPQGQDLLAYLEFLKESKIVTKINPACTGSLLKGRIGDSLRYSSIKFSFRKFSLAVS